MLADFKARVHNGGQSRVTAFDHLRIVEKHGFRTTARAGPCCIKGRPNIRGQRIRQNAGDVHVMPEAVLRSRQVVSDNIGLRLRGAVRPISFELHLERRRIKVLFLENEQRESIGSNIPDGYILPEAAVGPRVPSIQGATPTAAVRAPCFTIGIPEEGPRTSCFQARITSQVRLRDTDAQEQRENYMHVELHGLHLPLESLSTNSNERN